MFFVRLIFFSLSQVFIFFLFLYPAACLHQYNMFFPFLLQVNCYFYVKQKQEHAKSLRESLTYYMVAHPCNEKLMPETKEILRKYVSIDLSL